MKRLFKYKYLKLTILAVCIILSYLLFKNEFIVLFVSNLHQFKYLGVFLSGILISFGFTAPFAVGFFIVLNPQNIWFAGIIGGFGALMGDLLIFHFIKFNFMDEFYRLENTPFIKKINSKLNKSFLKKIKIYLMYSLAGILIATPLPDEIGITMLAGLTKINSFIFAIISFLLHAIGILVLLTL